MDVSEIEQAIYEATQLLSLPAAGLWLKMRYSIDRLTDRPGHLQVDGRLLSGPKLAIKAGSDSDTVSLLLAELASVGLVDYSEKEQHIWSPKLVAIAEARAAGREKVAKCRRNSNRGRGRSNDNDLRGVTNATCNPDVTAGVESPPPPPPPLSLSPTPPISIPSTTPTLFAPTERGDAAPLASAGPVRKRAAGAGGTGEETPESPFVAFRDWWSRVAWPQAHGGEVYRFDQPDGVAVAAILKSPWIVRRDAADEVAKGPDGKSVPDLDRAKAIATAFLKYPDFNYPGHTLMQLRKNLARIVGQMQMPQQGKGSNYATPWNKPKPAPADRGEFAEPARPLPRLRAAPGPN